MTILNDLFEKPMPSLIKEIREHIYEETTLTAITRENINSLITDDKIQEEIGYFKLNDGSYQITMPVKTPNITNDMLEWWFWWISKNKENYKVWYPKTHLNIVNIDKNILNYEYGGFKPCTYNIINDFGKGPIELAIKFRNTEYFGFNSNLYSNNNIGLVICGNIGSIRGLFGHSEIIHILKETKGNEKIITRLTIGKHLPSLLKRKILTNENLYILSKYIYLSYARLNEILPILYKNYREEFYNVEIEEIK